MSEGVDMRVIGYCDCCYCRDTPTDWMEDEDEEDRDYEQEKYDSELTYGKEPEPT